MALWMKAAARFALLTLAIAMPIGHRAVRIDRNLAERPFIQCLKCGLSEAP
jgi:hypothetical protein